MIAILVLFTIMILALAYLTYGRHLANREAALERGEEEVLDWEEAKARLRKEVL